MKVTYLLLLLIGAGFLIAPARVSGEQLTVNFDPHGTPNLPEGPPYFIYAGPMQTITVPGHVTFTGGVIVSTAGSNPLDAAVASAPNFYGTAVFLDTLERTLTITIDPAFEVHRLDGLLLNGEAATPYLITALNGASILAAKTYDVPDYGLGQGHAFFSLSSSTSITSFTITPTERLVWDFAIDSLVFNLPEPSSLILSVPALVALAARPCRRRR